MRQKRIRTTIKDGRKVTSGIFLVLAIIIGIILAAAAILLVSTGYLVDKTMESSGISVQINIYGDDIIVDIVGGERVGELQYILLIIDGYTLPGAAAGKAVSVRQRQIVYDSLAYGITGSRAVGVRGYFSDGSSHLLAQKSFKFT
ncbi:MAG: hypothetical protein Q4Q04_04300 [Methanocorpusculum sp.]|nr:hypothetical protein [Methanocorpusculum sp.]